MLENIIIPRPKDLDKLKHRIAEKGVENFHVITDFDRTLTKAFVDGKEVPSIISVLRDGNYLTPGYAAKAHALFDKYHPIELDIHISREEKKKAMTEWWTKHFDLLIKSKLNKKDVEKAAQSARIKFRTGALEFIDLLYKHKIPLVIMSSSGLGDEGIRFVLKREKRMYDHIYIISNSLEWDKNGYAIGMKKPIIHVMNKDETSLKYFPFFGKIKDRKNVLLLGDNISDIGMVHNSDHENIIKIGFLNKDVERYLDEYKKHFDAIILNDYRMKYVNDLLKEILKK